ncbi:MULTISPECIES: MarR family winged helix-turn-helix transcriptional regulator [Alphaproteobacteria]|uniref:Transcriptional regulator n=2 Tax=Alphaproteobacteria TaxID=28211 RepID=A0A512HEF1_9HYPH|nr:MULTISPECIES: MarR family winged helix-turn-helix transcriptional regulator [Alphaproteobacteria]GEO83829.1 transcriptional regulator [Ciceribacter naphthalenivorans]GLR21293.1 transcriptional regulator [Ciceribacter naphthalenivorans]GLT04149.1 transcriptional regulator [Sphingomonas psychrolutea]
MQDRFDIDGFLPFRLDRVAERLSAHFMRFCGEGVEISWAEWQVLWSLGERVHTTAKAICGHSGLSKTKISRAVKALEDRRWLERHRDRDDRRFELLAPTAAGVEAYAQLKRRALDYQVWLEGAIDTPYLKAMVEGLSGVEMMIASGQLRSLSEEPVE